VAEEKTSKVAKKIEMAANVAIVIAAIAIIFVLVRNYTKKPEVPPTIATGAKVPLKDVSWQSNPKSLVMVVSTTCHFCTESAGFYRQLVSQCKQQHVRTIAVLPQPATEAEAYLKNEGVAVDEIRQAALSDIPVGGTPTLLLVDGSGVVKSVWIGKLPDAQEKEVISKLGS
jgi:hypothetical protein